jgi:uroporphyrinogen decarboxylase
VEGGTTRTYTTIKSMCHTAPHVLRALLSHLTRAISDYIIFQVQSGAHCIQIFDSWGGQLPPDMWESWSRPYIEEVSWDNYGFTVVVLYGTDYVKLGTVNFSYT